MHQTQEINQKMLQDYQQKESVIRDLQLELDKAKEQREHYQHAL